MTTIIRIEGIEFYGFHGVSPEEKQVGHRYSVDVTLHGDFTKACETDDLADTVSYSDVARLIVEIGAREKFNLLERLASVLADAILERFPTVTELTLTATKLHPPAKVIVDRASVEVCRSISGMGSN